MHAEIEARDRARHEKELGHATFMDELNALEQQLDALNSAKKPAKDIFPLGPYLSKWPGYARPA